MNIIQSENKTNLKIYKSTNFNCINQRIKGKKPHKFRCFQSDAIYGQIKS